nr:site-specific integrase [uncultured Clostridium sp.]
MTELLSMLTTTLYEGGYNMAIMIRELEDLDIIIEEKVEFDIFQKKEYLRIFYDNVANGNIREGTNFYNEKWIIKVGGVEHVLQFPKEGEMKNLCTLFDKSSSEFELAYKSFILFNLHTSSYALSFNLSMKVIARDLKSAKIDWRNESSIKDFLEYVKISEEKSKVFKKIIKNIEKKEHGSRVLPEFEDIFLMSDIVNNIVKNENILDYKDYLLTIMWWIICSILPLRPAEFLRTKFDCIYEEKGIFYLNVKRSNGKSNKYIKNISNIDEYYSDDTVNIDENIFNLILRYRDILHNEFNYKEDIELFPFELIREASYRKNQNRRYNLDIITSYDLKLNVNMFYQNVVEKEYGLKAIPKYIKKDKSINYIEKTLPYDLRHIAIINLVLMGTDVLEVMYLCGHKKVNTAYGYFNHVKEFSRSYALGHFKSIEKTNMKKKTIKGVYITEGNLAKNKGKEDFIRVLNATEGKKDKITKVKGGYCKYNNIDNDKSFCFLYERNHTLCKYFVENNKEIIENKIKKVETQLDTNIKILIELIKDMNGISKFNELYQTTSYQLSKSIQELSVLNKKLVKEK